MAFHQSTDLYILIRSNKHRDYIGEFCQGIIGAAADDDAVPLLGEVLDDLALGCGDADGLIHQLDRRHGKAVADGHGVSGLNALFADVSDIALIKAVLLGDHLDDLVIIAGDAQLVGQTLAQRPPLPNSRLIVIIFISKTLLVKIHVSMSHRVRALQCVNQYS